MMDSHMLILLGFLGLAIGFVGGLVGLVLGVVRFPLILSADISAGITAGTNIGVSTMGALAAAVRHYRQNNVHLRIFVTMASTGAGGAFLGSLVTRFVSVNLLLVTIGVIVSYEAYSLILGSKKKVVRGEINERKSVVFESLVGFGIGFLGGLVGLVLGSIRMPAMISVLKMEPRVAVGTNLAAASVMGFFGLLGHVINGEVDYLTMAVMGSMAMVGGVAGARFTGRFSAEKLKMLIGFILVIVAISMFLRAIWVNVL
ncbi:MAG TPA: sulfite exporter TauE/SafE family protein [Candidatus Nitrosotalea sp.]|nr:sulfite exporter TauE/SafE family protein [Candidatus Nitrosotalea sp.]